MSLEFNPFTGKFDFVGVKAKPTFSFRKVILGATLVIAAEQEMIVSQFIEIDGSLEIEGVLTVDDLPEYKDNFSQRVVDTRTVIPLNQQMIVTPEVEVVGELVIDGELVLEDFVDTDTDTIPPDNFSWSKVVSLVEVPANQQMIVDGEIDVQNELRLEGSLSLLGGVDEDDLPWFRIPEKKVITVSSNAEYFLSQFLILEGLINVEGNLVIGA